MKITNHNVNIRVAFESHDWTNGKARKAIAILKNAIKPNGNKVAHYNQFQKVWNFTPLDEGLKLLTKLEELRNEGNENKIDMDLFDEQDTENWLKETFDNRDK